MPIRVKPCSSIMGWTDSSKPPSGLEDRLGAGGGPGQRVRPSRARPILEAHAQDDGAAHSVRGAQAPGDAIDEPGQGRLDLARCLGSPTDRAL